MLNLHCLDKRAKICKNAIFSHVSESTNTQEKEVGEAQTGAKQSQMVAWHSND
jgi:hypothetical protein